MDAKIYKKRLLQMIALLRGMLILFLSLPSQIQPRLTFNYHFIYKEILASYIEVV